ncbi:MAG: cytochrome c-type biogenesis protein CcmH [Gammaproteobacteria bacterium]|nr:cytochrome c-type biogenesis protein CcmH [Gammaproteobacteria bacterium]
MKILMTLLVTLGLSAAVFAIDSEKAFDDPVQQARYEELIAEVRCVTCQNQNIKDSNAFIAADLRREIRRLMTEGKSNDEIGEFLVSRYGDFVLYRPRMTGKSLILWLAPFVLLLFAGVAIVRVVRHRMSLPLDEQTEEGGAQ